MKITDWTEIQQPLVTDTGEIVYELIGSANNDGTRPNHSLARIVIPPGKSSTNHHHRVSEETYYILEGEGQMQVNGKDFTLKSGQTCFLSAGDIHQIENRGAEDLVFLAVCVPAWVPGDSFVV